MGCFDSVIIPCPNCKKQLDFQSKAGDCLMGNFTLENAPYEILVDLDKTDDICIDCGAHFIINIITTKENCPCCGHTTRTAKGSVEILKKE